MGLSCIAGVRHCLQSYSHDLFVCLHVQRRLVELVYACYLNAWIELAGAEAISYQCLVSLGFVRRDRRPKPDASAKDWPVINATSSFASAF